jgi:hypothetical protein
MGIIVKFIKNEEKLLSIGKGKKSISIAGN